MRGRSEEERRIDAYGVPGTCSMTVISEVIGDHVCRAQIDGGYNDEVGKTMACGVGGIGLHDGL